TPNGTRALVYLTWSPSEDEIDTNVIDALQSNHLIREVWLSGARWYELTHDRLIGPIKDGNEIWKLEHERKMASELAESNKKIQEIPKAKNYNTSYSGWSCIGCICSISFIYPTTQCISNLLSEWTSC